jgi:hypothetical protein
MSGKSDVRAFARLPLGTMQFNSLISSNERAGRLSGFEIRATLPSEYLHRSTRFGERLGDVSHFDLNWRSPLVALLVQFGDLPGK